MIERIDVLDRFHIIAYFSKSIDEVRADEARELKQEATLSDLVQMNLKTVKSYLLKEDFQNFWEYKYAGSAATFLDQWCFRAMRPKIEPIKKVAKMLRKHRELLLN